MSAEKFVVMAAEQTWQDSLQDAEKAADWLTDFMLMDDNAADSFEVPEAIPPLTFARLGALTGPRPTTEQLRLTRDAYMALSENDHYNAFLFITGYPQRAIAMFGDDMSEESINSLFAATAQHRELPKPAKAERLPSTGLEGMAHRQKMGRGAVRSAIQHDDDWDEPQSETRRSLDWQTDALCAQTDPEAFFPEKGGSTRDAKKVCTSCEVREECLEYALNKGERFGIWGGLSERERRKYDKVRGGEGAAA